MEKSSVSAEEEISKSILNIEDPTTTTTTTPKAKREIWGAKVDFLFACVGYSVGLGNVWRFPYLCYRNGGGAFLVPYIMFVALVGFPMFFLEVAIGQFMRRGCIMSWNICPLLQGMGLTMTCISILAVLYYIVIVAWTLHYLFSSFQSPVPWSHCQNEWNTVNCQKINMQNISNVSVVDDISNISQPSTEYWKYRLLRVSDGIENIGTINWDLALCLLFAWVLVYICIFKGIKVSGKVMYFTAPAPYVFMLILLIRGFTLPGSLEGVKYYLLPEIKKLADVNVWVDAGTQVAYSYAIGVGCLMALGSYNKFHHNSYKDCMIFCAVNSGTSLLAGLVIFTVLGFMSHNQGVPISKVAESGPGLGFIAYPEALSQMPFPPVWSVLFFCMLLLLGLDSCFVTVEGYITSLQDLVSDHRHQGLRKQILLISCCIVSFLVGLSMVSEGGIYVFMIFDYYTASRTVLLVIVLECIVISYCYGINRFYNNVCLMLGFRISLFLKACWCFLTPAVTFAFVVFSLVNYGEITYDNTYSFPIWSIVFGWLLAVGSLSMIPILAIYKIASAKGTLFRRITFLLKPQYVDDETIDYDRNMEG